MAAPVPEKPGVPEVALVRPQHAALHWTVRQPGYIEAFEETAIVPKISGYIEAWNVDIGDRVSAGDVLAVLRVPDLAKELEQKAAEVEQARKLCEVSEAHVVSVAAQVEEARAGVRRSQAGLKFRRMQHDRVGQLLNRSVINKQVEEEAWNELQAAEAAVSEAEAKLARATADLKESEAVRDKNRVDVTVAQAARARSQSLFNYATLRAPFDGVVSRRRANRGDFVQPPGGAQREPLYVIERRDVMRVFVEVPESDAVWIKAGTAVQIETPILKGQSFTGKVRRTAYVLNRESRTLLTEIDLPNPDDLLRPGTYATAVIQVERDNVLSLPTDAVATRGDVNEGYQSYCFLVENGKVRRLPIEVGLRGEHRVQVLKKQVNGLWIDFDGEEPVADGAIRSLTDDQEVRIAPTRQRPYQLSRSDTSYR